MQLRFWIERSAGRGCLRVVSIALIILLVVPRVDKGTAGILRRRNLCAP